MKQNRFHGLITLAIMMGTIFWCGTVNAAWMGNTAIQVNGTWYRPSTNPAAWPDTTFTTQTFTTTTLTLGGQFQTYDGGQIDNCTWNGNTGLDYVITQASTDKLSGHAGFTYAERTGNDNIWKSNGSSTCGTIVDGGFASKLVDISTLTPGNYTLKTRLISPSSVYAPSQTTYDEAALIVPGIVCAKTTHTFSSIKINEEATEDLGTFSAYGFSSVTAVLSGTNASEFEITSPISISSNSGSISVKFKPTTAGSKSATLTLTGTVNSTDFTHTITLSGTAYTTPTLATAAATSISSSGATVNGTISSNGYSNITDYGFYYSTVADFADGAGTKAQIGTSNTTGNISKVLTSLTGGTTYYYKVYATNTAGTSYSTTASFETTLAVCSAPFALNDAAITFNHCDATKLMPQVTASSGVLPAGATYSWTPSDGLSVTNIAQPTFTGSAAKTYVVTVTNPGDELCFASAEIAVSYNDNTPETNLTTTSYTVEAGHSISISGASATGNYEWSATSGSFNQTTGTLTPTYTAPLTGGSYTITLTSPAIGSCGASSSSASVTVREPITFKVRKPAEWNNVMYAYVYNVNGATTPAVLLPMTSLGLDNQDREWFSYTLGIDTASCYVIFKDRVNWEDAYQTADLLSSVSASTCYTLDTYSGSKRLSNVDTCPTFCVNPIAQVDGVKYDLLADAIASNSANPILFLNNISENITLTTKAILNPNDKALTGKVTVTPSGTLSITNNLTVVGDLVLQTSSTGESQLTGTAGLTVSATAMYIERLIDLNLEEGKYYGFSAPFDIALVGGILNADNNKPIGQGYDMKIYEWDGIRRANTGYVGNKDSIANAWQVVSGDLTADKAYLIAVKNVTKIKAKAKTPSITLASSGSATLNKFESTIDAKHAGWNLIAQKLTSAATSSLSGFVQILKGADSYETKAITTSTSIAPNTVFFYQSNADGSVSLSNTVNAITLRNRENIENELFEVTLSNTSTNDRIYFTTSETANTSYTIGKHLSKMGIVTTRPQLFVRQFDENLSVSEAARNSNEATLALRLVFPTNGSYTLDLKQQPTNTKVYLTENGQSIWNLSEGAYTFNKSGLTTYDYTSNLGLRVVYDTNITTEVSNPESGIKVYTQHNVLHMEGLTPGAQYQIFDIAGRLLVSRTATTTHVTEFLVNQGIYIVKTDECSIKVVR